MQINSRNRPYLSHVALQAVAVATLLMPGPAHALSNAKYAPPVFDRDKVCIDRQAHAVALTRDWTLWDGGAVDTSPNDLFAIAGEYLAGSDRVEQSLETSARILDYLSAGKLFPSARIDRLVGRVLIARAEDSSALSEGEALLLRALDGGVARAAYDLGQFYGPYGPTEVRDPLASRKFFRISAASADTDGQLEYAKDISLDPTIPDAEKNGATDNALLSMIQQITAGDCKYMETVGFLYLHGQLVVQNYDMAALWFEEYAKTGDAHIQERVGRLLSSRLVTDVDYNKAMDYLEAAGAQGRPFAALTVGKAYATGVGRTGDLNAAARFLTIAADAGLNEANYWLARLYQGEFGGAPQPTLAKERYEIAIAAGGLDANIQAEYGEFLAETVAGVSDPEKALELLEGAALGGSGRAAVLVARMYFAQAAADPSLYDKAEEFYRLGVELGKPEAARALSKMYACGQGVPLSIAKANEWNDRAYHLGSGSALYDAGVQFLIDEDPVLQAKGRTLVKQAALLGYPAAIGYAIAHYESGLEGIAKDLEAAQRLQRFIDNSSDPAFKIAATIETIKARLRLPQTADEIAAQYALLESLIAGGAVEASIAKAELLSDSGKGDPAELRELFRVGAEAGDARAMREYALLLLADPTVDVAIGRDWLAKAAAAGDVKAEIFAIDTTAEDALQQLESTVQRYEVCTVDEMVTLARAYAGVIDESATEQATFWLDSASQVVGHDADDLFKIADAYRDGVAGPDAIANAESYFRRSAELGRQTALRDIADGHLLGLWKESSATEAKVLLAGLFETGDLSAGSKLIEAIADQQVPATVDEIETVVNALPFVEKAGETYLKLARLDTNGAFGPARPDIEMKWLQRSADAGNPNAMIRLYRAYAAGIGVPAAPETAVAWLVKAADAGDPRAASELAAAYELGFGVPVDLAKAAEWRSKTGGPE